MDNICVKLYVVKIKEEEDMNTILYKQVVGSLMYAMTSGRIYIFMQ